MEGLNLLPWRIQQKEKKQRQFFIMSGMTVISSIGIIILLHVLIADKIQQQIASIHYLQTELTTLSEQLIQVKQLKTKKIALIQKLNFIYKLHASRPLIVNAFDNLVRIIPQGLYIQNIKLNNTKFTLVGKAESNGRVAVLMQNIATAKWFSNPILKEVTTKKINDHYSHNFILNFRLTANKKI